MLYLFVALAGILNAVQAGSNATLHKHLLHPIVCCLVSFGAGTVALLVTLVLYGAITKEPLPSSNQWSSVPWWAWIGGMLGAVYILSTVLAAEKVGSATFMGLSVAATILASLVIDHYGLVGFHRQAASPGRLLGGALMIAGVWLIGKF